MIPRYFDNLAEKGKKPQTELPPKLIYDEKSKNQDKAVSPDSLNQKEFITWAVPMLTILHSQFVQQADENHRTSIEVSEKLKRN